jgi:hypothetical protein
MEDAIPRELESCPLELGTGFLCRPADAYPIGQRRFLYRPAALLPQTQAASGGDVEAREPL